MKNSSKPTAKKNRGRQKTNLQPAKTSKAGRVSAPTGVTSPVSEQAFRGAFEGAQDGLLLLEGETGTIIEANPAIKKMLGYSRSEIIGKTLGEIDLWNDTITGQKIMQELQKKGRVHYKDFPIKTKGNGCCNVEFSSSVYQVGEQKVLQFNFREIEDQAKAANGRSGKLKRERVLGESEIRYRTKAEQELETSHSLLEAAIDSTADGLLIVDLKGNISQFNRKFVELWHIPQDILATGEDEKAIAFVLDQLKDPAAFLAKVKELYSHPQAESFDVLDFKDGRTFERYSQPHRLGEKIVGRVWSFRDVSARKRAEEALSKSEAELRALVEQVPAIIYTESADQPGKTIYISPQIEAITGYTPAEWMSSPNFWDEIVHPEDLDYLNAEDARTNLTGEPFRAEYRIYTRERGILWILDEAVLIHDNAGRALFWQGVMHDISDKKMAEKAQRESQARFTTIFNTSPISISITRLEDGRLIEVNPAFQEMYGFTHDEVVGHTLSELKICLTKDECGLMMKTLINGGQVRNFETKFRRKSGEIGDLLTSADLINLAGEQRMISVQQDITDRKRTEDALSKSEAEMRALFTAMPDLVMVIDKDGRYTSIAPTAHNLLYRPPEELVGKTIADVFPQEQAVEFLGSIRTALKENRTVQLEYSLVIEGKIVWFSASISPMTEEMVVWIARDITERKQAEEMVRRSAEELKQAQSFAHVGSFAWDLKTGRLEFSDELNRIFGFKKKSAPDLMVNAFIKTIHPDDQNVVEDIFASVARNEKPAPHEFRILWPDGSVHLILVETGEFNMDEAGKPAMIKGIAQDITERRRAEAALLQSEELFRTAFRTSPDSININRLEDGLYVDINEGFTSMTGYTREETLGRSSAEINIWVDLADRRRLVEGLKKDGEVNNLEAKFRRKDGRVLTGLMSAKVIQLKGVPHILSITRNIEEIKRTEMALRESNKELARLYRASAALISGAFLNTGEQAQKIVEVVQQEFGQDNCSLFIIQEDSNELVRLATAGPYADQVRNAKLTLEGNGLVARAIQKGETINVPDVHAEPDYVPNWEEAQSELAIPLKIGENVIGAIDVQSSQLNAFSPDDERPMTIFAERAALILEHSRLSTQMETRIQQLVALRTVDMAISGSFDINLTLGVLLDQVMGQLGAHAADILIFNAATQTFKFACERGFRLQTLRHIQLKYGTGYVWRAVRERQVINIPDINAGLDGLQRSPDLSSEHFVTYLGIPLIAKGQIRGVLEVFHREPVRFEPEKNSFLEILAGQAAIAIDNAELFDNLQSSNSDLSLAYEKTLEGWANALELRDQSTVGHTRRTTDLTIRLARAMGIKDSDIVHLYRGALLHDIGKMGVPDSIVLKRDPLTEEEWVSMRRHPQYAYDMLSPISYLHLALDIPYCHHERWDGSGYPRGLKGDQIPLSARIFAVVDVWDALTSERPYRKEWTQAKARQYLKENAGKQFDPEVVKVFLREIK